MSYKSAVWQFVWQLKTEYLLFGYYKIYNNNLQYNHIPQKDPEIEVFAAIEILLSADLCVRAFVCVLYSSSVYPILVLLIQLIRNSFVHFKFLILVHVPQKKPPSDECIITRPTYFMRYFVATFF